MSFPQQYPVIELVAVDENQPKRRRRMSILLLSFVGIPICIFCFYAFGSGMFNAYKMAQQEQNQNQSQSIHHPGSVEDGARTDECRARERLAFKKGYVVARLENLWENIDLPQPK